MRFNSDGFTFKQYFGTAAAMAGIGLVSHFFDQSPAQLTALKVILTPVIVLGAYAIERQFDVAEAYRRWSMTFIERVLAMSFVLAAGISLLFVRPETTMPELASIFVVIFVFGAIIAAIGPLGRRRDGT